MAVFTVEMRVSVDSYTEKYKVQFDAPSFDGLLADLNQMCKEILAGNIQNLVDIGEKKLPMKIIVGYEAMGILKIFDHVITKEELDKLKSLKESDMPPLDTASLQNDIQYGINMLRSESSHDGEKSWITNPSIVWQYFILQKHFGIPVPKELREQANNLQK